MTIDKEESKRVWNYQTVRKQRIGKTKHSHPKRKIGKKGTNMNKSFTRIKCENK